MTAKASFFKITFLLLFLFISSSQSRSFASSSSKPAAAPSQCGYAACDLGKSNMLNVHIVPHTHDDVGWLKTVDQYFYGYKNYIQNVGIQYILDTTIPELYADPSKRFIYVEMAYFYRWWNEQEENGRLKTMTRELVQQGRLQFILGGWSMNDEATTHYVAIIDQHTRGLKFLSDNFGDCGRPLVAWQIDPFGHSREQANLFAQMGYDALFFWRLDNQEKDMRLREKTMEMLWRGSDDLGKTSDLFTSLLYRDYCPPPGFCFDQNCGDAPIMDDPNLFEYNVNERVDDFFKFLNEQSKAYTSNHILIPMGCDFHFQNAHMNYKNIDKLIKHVNARQVTNDTKVNLIYSTPSCFAYAVNQANLTYTWKKDDFFPYADKDHAFWTGYFTSRPALKGYIRQANNILQASEQLAILSDLSKNDQEIENRVDYLRRMMGVMQHHDAVTGTEKQAVAFDYAQRLAIGVNAGVEVISKSLSKLLKLNSIDFDNFQFCSQLNMSICEPLTNTKDNILLLIYNPQSLAYSPFIRLPVFCSSQWKIVDQQTQFVLSFDKLPITNRTKTIPERGGFPLDCEIVFQSLTISPLGFRSYLLYQSPGDDDNNSPHSNFGNFKKSFYLKNKEEILSDSTTSSSSSSSSSWKADPIFLENNYLRVDFDPINNTISKITNKISNISTNLQQSISYYYGFQGNNWSPEQQSSGAYVFRPADGSQKQFFSNVKITKIFKGNFIQEIHQDFNNSWATQIVRLYNNSRRIEIEWTIGPIPTDNKQGREVIMNYQTDLTTLGTFYTDANGRQLLLRRRNYRPSNFFFQQSEPVSGNYYPINSRILIEDVKKTASFMVLNDRSQGGGSISDGQVELMIHRRTINDDSYGVGESLQEPGADGRGLIVRGKHYLLFETPLEMHRLHRQEAFRIFHEPLIFFNNKNANDDFPLKNPIFTGLSKALPASIRVMTLDNWSDKTKLLRLEHIYQSKEDVNDRSKVQNVNIIDLFATFNITQAVELTLSANQILSQSQKLKWRSIDGEITPIVAHQNDPQPLDLKNITLAPMEIRTFKILTT